MPKMPALAFVQRVSRRVYVTITRALSIEPVAIFILFVLIIAAIGYSPIGLAQSTGREKVVGNCESGNQTINVMGYTSAASTPVQRTYPGCTVTVYVTGSSSTKASIFSDDNGTALANPFISSINGTWFFYVSDGRYDIQLSGAGITTTTAGDQQALDYRYISPLNGAVARLLKAKEGDITSVKDFGAMGDGTTDDTTAWQAAINSGQPIRCPAGTYIVQTVTINNPDTEIYGYGMGECILQAKTAGVGSVFDFATNSGHNLVRDLTINANGANYGIKCESSACFQNKYIDVEVYGATGTPGTGIYNTSNCYSQEWRGMRITNNNTGARFSSTCQESTILQSKLYLNNNIQLDLGDNSGTLRSFTIALDDIEYGGAAGTNIDIQVNQVDPLSITDTYFESGAAASADISFAGTGESRVKVSGVFSNANVAANHAILLNSAKVLMTMKDSYYFNGLGSTFDSETANSSLIQFMNTAKADIGCSPSIPNCTSPTQHDFIAPDAQFINSLRAPWLNTTDNHTGNVLTMTSAGSRYGQLTVGSSSLSSWCLGSSTSPTTTLGTCAINWDGLGEIWFTTDAAFPTNPYGRTLPGLLWDNVSKFYLSAAGQLNLNLGDTNRTTNGKWWNLRLIDSTGDLQSASENDNGSGQNVPLDLARNGAVGLANAAACTSFANCGEVTVQGGMQLFTTGTPPTCSATSRGEFYVTQGATGAKDVVGVCAKDASNNYAWRSIY